MSATTLRTRYGSLRPVKRVSHYDPVSQQAQVTFNDGTADTVALHELEALDADGNRRPVEAAVVAVAEEVAGD